MSPSRWGPLGVIRHAKRREDHRFRGLGRPFTDTDTDQNDNDPNR
jgi:hypothetical protein